MYTGPEEEIRNDTLRERIYLRHHESGLPVYFCPKPGFQKRYACFATNYGSIDSRFRAASGQEVIVPDGVAHFLEHKVFEREDGNALEIFSRRGASCNAYTSYSVTNYLFSCSRGFYENLDLLVDFVLGPYITEDNVEKEKGIIAQEIQGYDDHPGWRVFTNLLEALYHDHPVRKDIAGTVDTIAKIDRDVLYTCHQSFYHPENMILFGIGDEDRNEFFDHVDSNLSQRTDWRSPGAVERHRFTEPDSVFQESITATMEVSMPRLYVGFKDRRAGSRGTEFLALELVSDILLELIFGKATPFFERMVQRKLIDDGFSSHYSAYGDVGFSLVGGETAEPEALAGEILDEVDRVRRDGIEERDFERQKRSLTGSFLRYFNSLEFTADNFCSYRFHDVNLFDLIDVLHGLEFPQVLDRLDEHLRRDAAASSIIQPRAAEAL